MGQLAGPTDPARRRAVARTPKPRKGFFTDTSICIGCKACEVACKEWNRNPQDGDLELLGRPTTTPASWAPAPGATSRSSSRTATASTKRANPGAPWSAWACRAGDWATTEPRLDTTPAGHARVPLADVLGRVQALHARRLPGRLSRPARCSAPSSAPSWCRTTSATAAAPASRAARSASSSGARDGTYTDTGATVRRTGGEARHRRRPEVHALLRPARRRTRPRPAPRPARPTSIKFGDHDELVAQARERVAELHARG